MVRNLDQIKDLSKERYKELIEKHVPKWNILAGFMDYGHYPHKIFSFDSYNLPIPIYTRKKINFKDEGWQKELEENIIPNWHPTLDLTQASMCEKKLLEVGNFHNKNVDYNLERTGVLVTYSGPYASHKISGEGPNESMAVCDAIIYFVTNIKGFEKLTDEDLIDVFKKKSKNKGSNF